MDRKAGVALSTLFALNTFGWEDDVNDLPITYVFAYVSGSANASDTTGEVVLQAELESSEATDVFLPQVSSARLGHSARGVKGGSKCENMRNFPPVPCTLN